MSRPSPVDFYRDQVEPALFACLDAAFPEFAFRRTSKGWEGTRQTAPAVLDYCGLGPGNGARIFCNRENPGRFGVAGRGESWPWVAYVTGSHAPPKGKDYTDAVVELARLAGVDASPLTTCEVSAEQRAKWAEQAEAARAKADSVRAEHEAKERARRAEAVDNAGRAIAEMVRQVSPPKGSKAAPLDQTPLHRYLKRRGRDAAKFPGGHWPPGLFCARTTVQKKKHLAVIAPTALYDHDAGELVISSAQRIFIDEQGGPVALEVIKGEEPVRKAALPGVLEGAYFEFGERIGADGVLLLCEGVETGAALHQATHWPVRACISTSGLRTVVLSPDDLRRVRKIIVCGDLDRRTKSGNLPGQEAADDCADRIRAEYGLPAGVALPCREIAPDLVMADRFDGRIVELPLPPAKSVDWEDVCNTRGDDAVRSRLLLCLASCSTVLSERGAERAERKAVSERERTPAPDSGADPVVESREDAQPEEPDFGPKSRCFNANDADHWRLAQFHGTVSRMLSKKKYVDGHVFQPYGPILPGSDLDCAHEFLLAKCCPPTIGRHGSALTICVLNGERLYRWTGQRWVEEGDAPLSCLQGQVREYFRNHIKMKPTREREPRLTFVDAVLSLSQVRSIAQAVIDQVNIITPRDEFEPQFLIRPNVVPDHRGEPCVVYHAPHERRLPTAEATRIGLCDPARLLPILNGLVDLDAFTADPQCRTLRLVEHTTVLFNRGLCEVELPVEAAMAAWDEYEQNHTPGTVEGLRAFAWSLCPELRAFLEQTFKHTQSEAVPGTLRELFKVFGAVLGGEIHRYQKSMVFFVGPPGNGKSLLSKVIESVLGRTNCVASTVSQLDDQFHLHAWINAKLAIFPDLDISGRVDKKKIVELFKIITVGDPITINRKHQDALKDLRLRVAILCVTNQMPSLPDPTLALVRRVLVFDFRNFVPEERRDASLPDRLLSPTSLAGALLLMLCGLADLHEDQRFIQPKWSEGPLKDLEAQLSAYASFVSECVVIEQVEEGEPKTKMAVAELYRAFLAWCELEGRTYKPMSSTMMAELKPLLISKGWPSCDATRTNAGTFYAGLQLSEKGRVLAEQTDRQPTAASSSGGHGTGGYEAGIPFAE